MGWSLGPNKKESKLNRNIHLSLLPDCGCHATDYFTLLLPCLHHYNERYPQTMVQRKLLIPYFALARCFVLAMRQVVNIDSHKSRLDSRGGR